MTGTRPVEDIAQDVASSILAAGEAIVERFERNDGEAHILSFDEHPGIWETAEALGIATWTPDRLNLVEAAVRWLVAHRNEDWGFAPWPDITSRRSYVETSARVLLSLAAAQEVLRIESLNPPISKIRDWIASQQDRSNGGYGAFLGSSTRTLPTAFAIRAIAFSLDVVPPDDPDRLWEGLNRAAGWLVSQRNGDGGIGLHSGATSNICSASQAAWSLAVLGISASGLDEYIQHTVEVGQISDIVDPIPDPSSTVINGASSCFYSECHGRLLDS